MTEHEVSRTLLKSPPELWTECSDVHSLARHLGEAVGEIRITRLEPETTVAWEGDRISGTVRLEPSGWGTKVTLTASGEASEPVASPGPEVEAPELPEPPEPPAAPEPPTAAIPAEPRPAPVGLLGRMRRWFAPPPPAAAPEPAVPPPPPAAATPEPEPAAAPLPPEPEQPEASGEPPVELSAALESLGKAHHRPYSRA